MANLSPEDNSVKWILSRFHLLLGRPFLEILKVWSNLVQIPFRTPSGSLCHHDRTRQIARKYLGLGASYIWQGQAIGSWSWHHLRYQYIATEMNCWPLSVIQPWCRHLLVFSWQELNPARSPAAKPLKLKLEWLCFHGLALAFCPFLTFRRTVTEPLSPVCVCYVLFICDSLSGEVSCLG